ncbi:ABC transporter permease [Rhizobium sp. RCC_161_2]|uniref:ABC transporter permease n=1 Tax=Rhizobium sp. RCC_161_2 TaxID=3239219 RepID=UPI0035264198
MNAVILRDMRTRFFGHGLGFLVVPLWPFVHMSILIIIHSVTGRVPPYGDSTPVFFATGLIPTLVFVYVSRFMVFSLMQNRPMLAFPVVQVSDIVMGRAFLEILAAFATLGLIFVVLWVMGQNPFPNDMEWAVCGYLATLWLAFGVGYCVGIMSMFFPMIVTAYNLTVIIVYITSGSLFVASDLPLSVSYYLSFNPVLECVEWMRASFYENYSDKLVSPLYVLSFATISLLLGLSLERCFRRTMLEGK